jgi:hypothetical protein
MLNLFVGRPASLMITKIHVPCIKNRRGASMERKLRLFATAILALFAVACTPNYIKMYNVHEQPIPHELTEDQVRRAINIGAGTAGWHTEELTPGSMVATYNIRAHTVKVLISYTEQAYNIDYKTSYEMKVFCTEEDKEEQRKRKITTGGGTCPDQPAYIHENYKVWVDELNRGISSALQNIE